MCLTVLGSIQILSSYCSFLPIARIKTSFNLPHSRVICMLFSSGILTFNILFHRTQINKYSLNHANNDSCSLLCPTNRKHSIENVISEIQTGWALLLSIFGDDERRGRKQLLKYSVRMGCWVVKFRVQQQQHAWIMYHWSQK